LWTIGVLLPCHVPPSGGSLEIGNLIRLPLLNGS